jgi:hypothetical protein
VKVKHRKEEKEGKGNKKRGEHWSAKLLWI